MSDQNKNYFCECILCNIVNGGHDISGRTPMILLQNDFFIATVDIGSIVEGYILITSKRHINSMGELTDAEYSEFIKIQEQISKIIKKIYNKKCICFEHGSGKNNKEYSASSIKHAHFHMVAIDKFNQNLHNQIIRDMNMFLIESQRQLKKYINLPYILYIDGNGKIYVSINGKMENQYMRKKVAEQYGMPYNWKIKEIRERFIKNVIKTEKKWKESNFI